jgi:PilZ domain
MGSKNNAMKHDGIGVLASHHESRQAERLDVTFSAGLREHGTTKFSIKVTDLSVTGFRCETSFTLTTGTRVWLTIPGLSGLEAQVAWRDGFRYGCAFIQPLHQAVLSHIFAQLKK